MEEEREEPERRHNEIMSYEEEAMVESTCSEGVATVVEGVWMLTELAEGKGVSVLDTACSSEKTAVGAV